jgi:hypothetical protein
LAVKCEKHTKKLIEKLFKSNGDNSAPTSSKDVSKKSSKKQSAVVKNKGSKKNVNSDLDMEVEEFNPTLQNDSNIEKEIPEKNQTSINNDSNMNKVKEESEKKLNSSKINSQPQAPDVEMSEKDDGDDPHDSLHTSSKEREKLAERIKCLANDGLASVVRLVQKECPNCIEDLNDEKLMIRITEIDRKTYEQINA